MTVAGRILREVNVAKAREGILNDAEPRFDTEHNKLYFRTSLPNVATMKKILARIESGAPVAESPAPTKGSSRPTDPFFTVEVWLVRLQLPKGEEITLSGPRGEVLTVLGGLEKESKAEILNHVSLTAEERKLAESKWSESVAMLNSFTTGGGPARRDPSAPGGPGADFPTRAMAGSVSHQSLESHIRVTAQSLDAKSALLDFSISKTFLGKPEDAAPLGPDAATPLRQPNKRQFEVESAIRLPLGSVMTAASQSMGGEKPSDIRVLILVNPL